MKRSTLIKKIVKIMKPIVDKNYYENGSSPEEVADKILTMIYTELDSVGAIYDEIWDDESIHGNDEDETYKEA